MDWNMLLTNLLIALIAVFVPVLGTMVTLYLRRKLADLDAYAAIRLGEVQWDFAKSLIKQFVMAAEQMGVWDELLAEGKDKKDWVLEQVDSALQGYGIDLDMVAVNAAIEQAVKQMQESSPVVLIPVEESPVSAGNFSNTFTVTAATND